MEWYESEVQMLERSLATQPPPPASVIFYGSSSIRLWTTLANDFADIAPLNLGFGGATLAACTYFFDRLVGPHCPRSIIFYAGDNDLGDGHPPMQVVESLRNLIAKLDALPCPITFSFISIKPSPARWSIRDRINTVNKQARALIEARPTGVYIDIYQSMLTADGLPRTQLFEADGLHLSPSGYQLWVQVLNAHRHLIF